MTIRSEYIDRKAELLADVLSLYDNFLGKLEAINADVAAVGGTPPSLSVLQTAVEGSAFQAACQNVPSSSRAASPMNFRSNMATILTHKRGIEKFPGTSMTMFISAFFEKVDELRMARNVSEDILLKYGLDLFEDKAYQFYKECRRRVSSWGGLMVEFRSEYLSANHNEVLVDDLRRRTQHSSESIGVYLAVLSSYFNRLQ